MTDTTPDALVAAGFQLRPHDVSNPIRRYYAPISDGPPAALRLVSQVPE